jgi:hypothetical protein
VRRTARELLQGGGDGVGGDGRVGDRDLLSRAVADAGWVADEEHAGGAPLAYHAGVMAGEAHQLRRPVGHQGGPDGGVELDAGAA